MINETTLYYIFSTISQTLAGAIALMAAFILYRLQVHNSELDYRSEAIWKLSNSHPNIFPYGFNSTVYDLKNIKDYQGIIDECNKAQRLNDVPGGSPTSKNQAEKILDLHKNEMDKILIMKSTSIKILKKSMFCTLITIIYSVAMIFVTPLLFNKCIYTVNAPAIVFSILGIIMFVYCLYTYKEVVVETLVK